MKTIVVHHSADFDGLFCREIARKFLPDAQLIGWDFGEPTIKFDHMTNYYVMDLPIDRVFGFDFTHPPIDLAFFYKENFTWIDHHKSSIETHPTDIPGYRIDGVAACRLAWQWFTHDLANNIMSDSRYLPTKEDYVDRRVEEPLAVRLAGEYDIWDKRDPRAELFQHGLRSRELSGFDWGQMLIIERPSIDEIEKLAAVGHQNLLEPDGTLAGATVWGLLESGKTIQYVREKEYEAIIKQQGFDLHFEGLCFLACNSHELDIRSHLFEAGIKPHHDALLGFTFNGKDWRVSMYCAPGKDHDLSKIAVKYGGGGHKFACGFRLKNDQAYLLNPALNAKGL